MRGSTSTWCAHRTGRVGPSATPPEIGEPQVGGVRLTSGLARRVRRCGARLPWDRLPPTSSGPLGHPVHCRSRCRAGPDRTPTPNIADQETRGNRGHKGNRSRKKVHLIRALGAVTVIASCWPEARPTALEVRTRRRSRGWQVPAGETRYCAVVSCRFEGFPCRGSCGCWRRTARAGDATGAEASPSGPLPGRSRSGPEVSHASSSVTVPDPRCPAKRVRAQLAMIGPLHEADEPRAACDGNSRVVVTLTPQPAGVLVTSLRCAPRRFISQ